MRSTTSLVEESQIRSSSKARSRSIGHCGRNLVCQASIDQRWGNVRQHGQGQEVRCP